MEKLFKDYVDFNFESSCVLTPEFKSFATKFKNRLKKACAVERLEIVGFTRGHFFLSGFVRNPNTDKYAYFNVGDVRWEILGKPLKNCLVRRAVDAKNFAGGTNTYCSLPELVDRIKRLTA